MFQHFFKINEPAFSSSSSLDSSSLLSSSLELSSFLAGTFAAAFFAAAGLAGDKKNYLKYEKLQ